jgi:hypothetical protein
MKAKQVNEFEQGGNPYDTMGIGKYDTNYDFENPQEGDHIILLEEICSAWVKGPRLFFRDKLNDVLQINTVYATKTIFHYAGDPGWVDLVKWIDRKEDINNIVDPDEFFKHWQVIANQKYFRKLRDHAIK